MADTPPQKDPLGNEPGTIRGILALMFGASMAASVLMSAYRVQILDRPFIAPDALSIAFFFSGSTVVGLYFGLRVRQGANGIPMLGDLNDQSQVNINIKGAGAVPSAMAAAGEKLGTLADLQAAEAQPAHLDSADAHLQAS